jgi:hypothetical protein
MPVSPTGSLSLPPNQLRAYLIASPAWISWTGGAGQAAAQSLLVAAPSNTPFPHSLIDFDGNLTRTRDGANIGRFLQSGGLQLYFCDKVANGSTEIDAFTNFLNRVDAVMSDLELTKNQGGQGLTIQGYSLAGGPVHMPEKERDKYGDIMEILFSVDVEVAP